MIQDGSHQDEAPEVAESRAPCFYTSLGAMQCIGLEAGKLFVNPLHQMHEGVSKACFAPEQLPILYCNIRMELLGQVCGWQMHHTWWI